MRASVVIASCNEGDLLRRTVASCLDTVGDLDCEVVVADDASEDGSADAVRREFPSVRVVAHARRRGVSLTKDLAARSARGRVLIFLDAHCKPEAGALARLVEGVEELEGKAVLTPAIANLDVANWRSDPDQVGYGYGVSLDTLDVWWIPLDKMPTHQATRFREQPTLIGCCAALTRKLYDRLWGFDTGMRTYGSEDVDLGVKSWLMGHPVLHDPTAMVGHRFRGGFDTYPVPAEHILVNKLRMGRKTLGDGLWFDWLGRFSVGHDAGLWESVWTQYLEGSESVERERAYLQTNRVRDEFWFARTFGLAWPGARAAAGPDDPAPAPVPGGEPPKGFVVPTPKPGAQMQKQTGNPSWSPEPLRRFFSPSPDPVRR
jgi:GT2 family glycosyltransferase